MKTNRLQLLFKVYGYDEFEYPDFLSITVDKDRTYKPKSFKPVGKAYSLLNQYDYDSITLDKTNPFKMFPLNYGENGGFTSFTDDLPLTAIKLKIDRTDVRFTFKQRHNPGASFSTEPIPLWQLSDYHTFITMPLDRVPLIIAQDKIPEYLKDILKYRLKEGV